MRVANVRAGCFERVWPKLKAFAKVRVTSKGVSERVCQSQMPVLKGLLRGVVVRGLFWEGLSRQSAVMKGSAKLEGCIERVCQSQRGQFSEGSQSQWVVWRGLFREGLHSQRAVLRGFAKSEGCLRGSAKVRGLS